jgi:hypothetical protein
MSVTAASADGNPIVSLYPWEYERAFSVGIARFTANWGVGDAEHYDRSRMEEDRNAQAAAAVCEVAVARYINEYWHGHVWNRSDHSKYKSLADVGENVEVRRVRTAPGVAVRKTDAGKIIWAAKIVDPEYRTVELLGFVKAEDAIESMGYSDWKYVPFDYLVRPWAGGDLSEGKPRAANVESSS